MRHALMITAALALLCAASTTASAQGLDKAGKCRGPDGKFAAASSCKGAGPAPAVASSYKLDAKGKCHDAKGKFAKKEMCVGAPAKP
jgi:hypothetical protein